MSKPNRNDPCPCGSGKKYKRCCGHSNVIEISPQLYNDELGQLHDNLISYALENFEELFMEQTEFYYQPFFAEDSIATEDYLTGLTLWTILNDPLLKNDQTIYDAFYSQQKGKIKRTRTKNTFLEWANTVPSVYEMVETDLQNTHLATIRDIATNKKYQVPIIHDIVYPEGTMLIGSLIPFVDFHYFFFETNKLREYNKNKILYIINEYSRENNQFSETFPDFLAEVLLNEMDDAVDYLLNDEVATLFMEHMANKGIDNQIISLGINIWKNYLVMENPNFKKPATYAAALEYIIQVLILENHAITQKEIAEEYGTTAGTVSTNYRKVMDFIINTLDEADLQPSHNNSVSMEREMKNLEKVLSEQEFDTLEEADDFINHMLHNDHEFEATPLTPRDQAQDLLYDARETHGIKRKNLIEEALSIYPNSSDAYLLLAEDANSELEFGANLKKAVQVGEKDLGKAFFLENKGHFWMMIETRPYMRAKAMYAEYLYKIGDEKKAFQQYEEMLRLNPNDNQGIRYILLTMYIETAQYKKAQELINEFSDEGTAIFLFNKILVDYFINGFTNQTKNFIKEANKQNPFIKDYLLGNKKAPSEHFSHIGFGDETEAIVYVQENIHLWKACPELLKEL